MAFLIAVSGLSGSGKTTAVNHLMTAYGGTTIYLGGLVIEEVARRGLPICAENEKIVRLDIRRKHGPGALAVLATPSVQQYLSSNLNVFVDAIFVLDEYRILQKCSGNTEAILLAIDACFETRCRRLGSRAERPLSREQVKDRDEVEIAELKTPVAMAEASYKIANENTMDNFLTDLDSFWEETSKVTSLRL
jgi:dephospho-CoA kinase